MSDNPSSETAPRTLTRARSGVAAYDFRRPTQLSRESVRVLQVTFETFSRRLTTLLTSSLRQVCHVSLTDISQQTYDEYISGRPSTTLIAPIALPTLNTSAVIEYSVPVALSAIDHMLGGPGGEQPVRSLTDIETTLIRGLMDQMIGVLEYSFEQLVTIRPRLGMIEYNPQFIQVVNGSDAVLVVLMQMAVGSAASELTLCIPLAPLLPKLAAVQTRSSTDNNTGGGDETRLLTARLAGVPVDVRVEFSPVAISPERILTLSVGDVIPLTHRVGRPLGVRVGDVTYASAVAGKSGRRLAALITDTIRNPKEQV